MKHCIILHTVHCVKQNIRPIWHCKIPFWCCCIICLLQDLYNLSIVCPLDTLLLSTSDPELLACVCYLIPLTSLTQIYVWNGWNILILNTEWTLWCTGIKNKVFRPTFNSLYFSVGTFLHSLQLRINMHFTMFDDPAILLITEIIVNELCSPCVCVYIYINIYMRHGKLNQ